MPLSRRHVLGLGAGGLLLPVFARSRRALAAAPSSPQDVVILYTPRGPVPIRVETVSTPETRNRGLMFRRHLPADAGMLFDFGRTGPVGMWMKNTYIPLDMLFIDESGVIVGLAEDTVPETLTPIRSPVPARAVLEVNAGTVRKLGLQPGMRVKHPMFAPALR